MKVVPVNYVPFSCLFCCFVPDWLPGLQWLCSMPVYFVICTSYVAWTKEIVFHVPVYSVVLYLIGCLGYGDCVPCPCLLLFCTCMLHGLWWLCSMCLFIFFCFVPDMLPGLRWLCSMCLLYSLLILPPPHILGDIGSDLTWKYKLILINEIKPS